MYIADTCARSETSPSCGRDDIDQGGCWAIGRIPCSDVQHRSVALGGGMTVSAGSHMAGIGGHYNKL